MRYLILTTLLFITAHTQAGEYLSIAWRTNGMTVGQISGLKKFKGEQLPPEMLTKDWPTFRTHGMESVILFTDGTNIWEGLNYYIPHIEKVRTRTVTIINAGVTNTITTSYGKPMTAIRIANIREPFNSSVFKIERSDNGEAMFRGWGLSPIIKEIE